MIEPTNRDIGRYVLYMDSAPVPTVEAGRISSFNDTTVFVSFPKWRIPHETTVQGCNRESLHWLDEVAQLLIQQPSSANYAAVKIAAEEWFPGYRVKPMTDKATEREPPPGGRP